MPSLSTSSDTSNCEENGDYNNNTNEYLNENNGNLNSRTGNGNGTRKKEKFCAISTSKTNLYIRGLDENITDNDLFEMCKKYGDIKSTKSIIDKQTGRCKGILLCFIFTFQRPSFVES